MFVYTVRPGDTLTGIALRFGLSADQIRNLNSLVSPDLVAGQALLIPSTRYQVQPGDTLWEIQQKTGVPWPTIARANAVTAQTTLYPGRTLRIPTPAKRPAEIMGYLPLTDPGVSHLSIRPWAHLLTYVSIFAYIIRDDGTVVPVNDTDSIIEARRIGASPLLSIANIRPGGAFSREGARALLTNADMRRRVLDEIMAVVEAKNYDGIDSDIEAIPRDVRDEYIDFLRELKNRLGRRLLTLAVPPKYDEEKFGYAAGHDYARIGAIADRVFIMNYEFHWVGGPPGPIAPIGETRRVLQYASRLMPANKLLNGILTTAYDWPLPDTPENTARPMSHMEAVTLAQTQQVPIRYNEAAEVPYFRYRDRTGQEREVWFEDARSLMAKLTMTRDMGIRGLGIWQLGAFSPQLPPLITHLFRPQKG